MAAGSLVVVIVNASSTTTLTVFATVRADASVNVTTTDNDPAVVGVPLISPLVESRLSPAGRPVADHVYGVVPPLPAKVTPKDEPTTAVGRLDVTITGAATIDKIRVLVTACLPASVNVTTTDDAPTVVGVPLITPVVESKLNPAGRPVADHMYGVVPPLPAKVAE